MTKPSPTEEVSEIIEQTLRRDTLFMERLRQAADLTREGAKLADFAQTADWIGARVSGIIGEMGVGGFRQFSLDPKIQSIVARAEWEALVPERIARTVAASNIIAPRLRLSTLIYVGEVLASIFRAEIDDWRMTIDPASSDESNVRMSLRVANRRYTLGINASNQLTLEGPRGRTELQDINSLIANIAPLRTPEECFESVRSAAALLAGRERWTNRTESALRAMLVGYVASDKSAAEYDRLDEWSISRSLGLKPNSAVSVMAEVNVDLTLAEIYKEIRKTADMGGDRQEGGGILPERHPLYAGSYGAFAEFIRLDSRLLWAKSRILEPFVTVMLESPKTRKDAKARAELMGIIEEHGMQYVVERLASEWTWSKWWRRFARYWELDHEAVTGIAKLDAKRHVGLGTLVHAIFDQFDTEHWPERKRFESFAGSKESSDKPERTYAERLIAESIDRAVDAVIADAYGYFADLYDAADGMGVVDPNGMIRIPGADYTRKLEGIWYQRAASPLIRATSADRDRLLWHSSVPANLHGVDRLNRGDFCLIMLAQALDGTNVSTETWSSIKERVEKLERALRQEAEKALEEAKEAQKRAEESEKNKKMSNTDGAIAKAQDALKDAEEALDRAKTREWRILLMREELPTLAGFAGPPSTTTIPRPTPLKRRLR